MIDLGKTHKYDFVTLAGDQAYNMEDFNGTKGDEYLNFMQDLYAQVPYLGAVGNHEGAYNFTHYKNRSVTHLPLYFPPFYLFSNMQTKKIIISVDSILFLLLNQILIIPCFTQSIISHFI